VHAQEGPKLRANGLKLCPALIATLAFPVVLLSSASLQAATSMPEAAKISFRGNGARSLPPFRIGRPSTLFWTSSGSIFQLFPSGLTGGTVNSQARRGWTYLAPARYRYEVNALSAWTIRVVAGTIRPQRMSGGQIGYRGNGALDLPPFITRRNTTLVWRSSGSIFQLFPKELSGVVNSQAHRGSTYLPRGKHTYTVNAIGSWTIAWRP
jgi:hypothetical protein